MAFAEGERCVAVFPSIQGDEEPLAGLTISFSLREALPEGKWGALLDMSGEGFKALQGLVDQANEYAESLEDDER